MTHLTVREWGSVSVSKTGSKNHFTHPQAIALRDAACSHPSSNLYGTNILIDRRDQLVAQQMVGVLSAPGCSLEILPKVDPAAREPESNSDRLQEQHEVRGRLVEMLDVALNLRLSRGISDKMAHDAPNLLEILITNFADKLLAEVRRGLPRRYIARRNELPALRGRLDIKRQFSRNAVRPDRLACEFDQFEADTPLLRIMAAAVPFLLSHSRLQENRRKLSELRHWLSEVPEVPVARLPWKDVRITRANQRWEELFQLASLLLRRDWQAIGRDRNGSSGITLLFPMNDLFEKYVAALLRRALAPKGIKVLEQGGFRRCLGQWTYGAELGHAEGTAFATKPDIRLLHKNRLLAVIDTKWKRMIKPTHKSFGVSQSDVYQLMAYSRLYNGADVALLYPSSPGQGAKQHQPFGIAGGNERFDILNVDVSADRKSTEDQLVDLCSKWILDCKSVEAGSAAYSKK